MDFDFNVPLAFGDAPACIVYMPEGEHFINASVGGRQKVIVDRSCLSALQRDLSFKLSRKVRPVCYFDHKSGPASFIPSSFDYLDGVGVLLKGEWTESGKKSVLGRDYSYFSPAFKLNMSTFRPAGLESDDIEVGSLVNDPAFESIARIAASKAKLEDFTVIGPDKPLNSDGEDTGAVHNQTNNTNTIMYELLVKCGVLTKEEAASDKAEQIVEDKIKDLKNKSEGGEKSKTELEAAKKEAEDAKKEATKCKASKTEFDQVAAKLKAVEEELAEVKASKVALIEAEIDAAVKAGKIAPEDEDAKEALKTALTASIKAGKALISSMQPNPAFASVVAGKANGGNGGNESTGRDRVIENINKEQN